MPATPDPDLGLRLAKETAEIYGQAVDDLLGIVARRLARGIDQPGWAEAKLIELAALRSEAQAVVERLQVLGPAAVERAVERAWRVGVADAVEVSGSLVPRTSTEAVLAREAVLQVASTHFRILRSVDDAYRAVISEVSSGVVTGSLTRQQAAQRALDRFADRGVTGLVDRAGRRWALDTYAEMATRTTAGRAQVQGALDRYQQAGRDLVIVSDAPGECALCRPHEGRVFSISGTSVDYPPLSSATGLWHANCRHSASLFVPGLTRPMGRTADPDGDAARQEQRRLERGVRLWRRREAVAMDDHARRVARHHRLQWEGRLGRHVQANDLKRLRYREIGRGPNLEPPFRARPPGKPGPSERVRSTAPTSAALVEPGAVIRTRPDPGRSDVGRDVDRALTAMARLHRVPADLTPVPVKTVTAQRYFGAYSFTPRSPGAIQIARHGDHKAMTFAHEFGHYLDHQLLGGAPGTWGSSSDSLAPWRDAIDRTEQTRRLRALPSDPYTRYYLRRDEQWARSYAQWVAVRSGDQRMLDQIAGILRSPGVRGLSQWDAADFHQVASAIDQLFEARGLLP